MPVVLRIRGHRFEFYSADRDKHNLKPTEE